MYTCPGFYPPDQICYNGGSWDRVLTHLQYELVRFSNYSNVFTLRREIIVSPYLVYQEIWWVF